MNLRTQFTLALASMMLLVKTKDRYFACDQGGRSFTGLLISSDEAAQNFKRVFYLLSE